MTTITELWSRRDGGLTKSTLSETQAAKKADLQAEYERKRAPFWKQFEQAHDALVAEYERQRDPLLLEYRNACRAAGFEP